MTSINKNTHKIYALMFGCLNLAFFPFYVIMLGFRYMPDLCIEERSPIIAPLLLAIENNPCMIWIVSILFVVYGLTGAVASWCYIDGVNQEIPKKMYTCLFLGLINIILIIIIDICIATQLQDSMEMALFIAINGPYMLYMILWNEAIKNYVLVRHFNEQNAGIVNVTVINDKTPYF